MKTACVHFQTLLQTDVFPFRFSTHFLKPLHLTKTKVTEFGSVALPVTARTRAHSSRALCLRVHVPSWPRPAHSPGAGCHASARAGVHLWQPVAPGFTVRQHTAMLTAPDQKQVWAAGRRRHFPPRTPPSTPRRFLCFIVLSATVTSVTPSSTSVTSSAAVLISQTTAGQCSEDSPWFRTVVKHAQCEIYNLLFRL